MPKPRDTSGPLTLEGAGRTASSDRPKLSAWMACAANAVPLWVWLVAMLQWGLGTVHPTVQVAAYVAVLALWIALFKPWTAQRDG